MSETSEFQIEEVDVEAVRSLRRKLLRPNQPPEAVEYMTDEDPSAKHVAALDPTGRVIGIGSLHLEDRVAGREPYVSPGMRLRGVAVVEDWQGRGVAMALIESMLAMGRDAGVKEAWANVRLEFMDFLHAAGFREVSSDFEITGIGLHAVMARSLLEKGWKAKREKRSKDGDAGAEQDGGTT